MPASPVLWLQQQRRLLELEYEYEKTQFRTQTEIAGITRKNQTRAMLVPAFLRKELLQLAQPTGNRSRTHGAYRRRPWLRAGQTSVFLHTRCLRRATTGQPRRSTALFPLYRHRKLRRRQYDGGSPAGHGNPFAFERKRPRRCATLLGRNHLPPDVRSLGPGKCRTAWPLGRIARHFSRNGPGRSLYIPTSTFSLAKSHTRNRSQRSVACQRRDDRARPSGNRQDHYPCGSHLRDAPPREPSIGVRTK